ncbi:MAG: hypothetical protein WA274_15720, partial [Candidatus Acidiferrales bacterium]
HLARLESEGSAADFQTDLFKHYFTSFLPRSRGRISDTRENSREIPRRKTGEKKRSEICGSE